MAASPFPNDTVREVFFENVMKMIEEDMERNDLKMYDVFLIWSLGKSRWQDTTLSKIRKEKNDGQADGDGDANSGGQGDGSADGGG